MHAVTGRDGTKINARLEQTRIFNRRRLRPTDLGPEMSERSRWIWPPIIGRRALKQSLIRAVSSPAD